MVVYRITTAKWADKLTASGFPARWNSKGTRILYTASSRALACLENLVHRSGEGLNQQFRIAEIYIPNKASREIVNFSDLPDKWFKMEQYDFCQRIGDDWIEQGKSLLLQVPSSVIQEETNVLINPNHSEFHQVKVQNISSFEFDERL